MTEYIKPITKLTGADIDNALSILKKGDFIYRANFSDLAKRVLGFYLPVNPFNIGFQELREIYIEETSKGEDSLTSDSEKVPSSEPEFYKYICDLYLWIDKEPCIALLGEYEKTMQDLKSVTKTLDAIKAKLEDIQKVNDLKDVYELKPIYYFYQEHNQRAKEEIQKFLLHEIKPFALNNCFNTGLSIGLMGNIPYNYRWNPRAYDPQMPDDLDNKLRRLPIREIKKLKKLHKDDRTAFNEFLNQYIKDEEVIFQLISLLPVNHILAAKSDMIKEALNIYSHGAKIMFVSAIPTVIEGILHEMCLLIGEKESELLKGGFQFKLDKLLPVLGGELYYEYFSFRFRILRNKVAHGRLTEEGIDELADFLLLDLFQISEMVSSTKFKLHQKRFVIDQLNKEIDFKYLIEYIHLGGIDVPRFYGIGKQIEEIEKLIPDDRFWTYLEHQLQDSDEIKRHGIIGTIELISKRKPFDARCTKLKKTMGLEKADKQLVKLYLDNLRRYY